MPDMPFPEISYHQIFQAACSLPKYLWHLIKSSYFTSQRTCSLFFWESNWFSLLSVQGLRPTIPKNTHPKLIELLERCWQQDPTQRPDFSEILETVQHLAKEVLCPNLHIFSPSILLSFWFNFHLQPCGTGRRWACGTPQGKIIGWVSFCSEERTLRWKCALRQICMRKWIHGKESLRYMERIESLNKDFTGSEKI